MKKLKLINTKGQALMEYVLVTGLIGIFCLFAVKKLGEQLERKVEASSKRINKSIKIK